MNLLRKPVMAVALLALIGQARAESALAEASAPVFLPGEEWTFAFSDRLDPRNDRLYTQVVTSAPTGGSTTLNVNNGRALMVLDQNANVVSAGSESYEPSDGKLQFPLSVGKSWSGTYIYKNGTWEAHAERHAKVVGIEQITTPAGTFDTFRIEQSVGWTGEFGNKGAGHISETDWYAPAVGRIIKMDYQSRTANSAARTTHIELQSAKPAPASSER
jgi:hypothetical protein